ncbi:MAG TPA: GtrA family protein, partial [Xanthobacteraceae bacterium]|nr:GtrA family protein [Xanthobacteraceae bacterium]
VLAAAGESLGYFTWGIAGIRGESWRYLLTSAVALACDLTVYTGLLHVRLMPAVAGSVGYMAGLLVHYCLSARWVFPDSSGRRRTAATFAKFAATGLAGVVMTTAIIGLITETGVAGAFVAKGVAMGSVYIVVFLLRRTLVFAASPTSTIGESDRSSRF